MTPITREEKIMSGENLTPITRKELFLAKAAGMDVKTPKPITREEMFLSKIGGGGGSVTKPCKIDITDNDYCGPYNVKYTSYGSGSTVNKVIPNGGSAEVVAVQGTEMFVTIGDGGYSLSSVGFYYNGEHIETNERWENMGVYITVPVLSECYLTIFG